MSDKKDVSDKKDDALCSIHALALKGMLDIWVISLLSKRKMNGYEMLKVIGDVTEGRWMPTTGALYPALHRLKKRGMITADKEGSRHQIVYSLTPKGKESVAALRVHVMDVYSKRKFMRMFEMLIWPNESENVRKEVDTLFDALVSLRNGRAGDEKKMKKIRKARDVLE